MTTSEQLNEGLCKLFKTSNDLNNKINDINQFLKNCDFTEPGDIEYLKNQIKEAIEISLKENRDFKSALDLSFDLL